MANVIEGILKLRDEMTPGLDRAGGNINRFSIQSIAQFAGVTLSVAGLVAMVKKLSNEAAGAEVADNRLAGAMRSAGQYTHAAYVENKQYAESLAKTVLASDEEIKSIETTFIAFNAQGEILRRLTRATLDFAAGNAAQGMTVESAAQLILRAWQGESESIGRLKLGIDGASASMERADSIWTQVEKHYSGRAADELNTYTGRVHEMREAWSEWAEQAGGGVNNIWTPLNVGLTHFAWGLIDADAALTELNMGIATGRPWLEALMRALGDWPEAADRAAGSTKGLYDATSDLDKLLAKLAREKQVQWLGTIGFKMPPMPALSMRGEWKPAEFKPPEAKGLDFGMKTAGEGIEETQLKFDDFTSNFLMATEEMGLTWANLTTSMSTSIGSELSNVLFTGRHVFAGLIAAARQFGEAVIGQLIAIGAKMLVLKLAKTMFGIPFAEGGLVKGYQFGGMVHGPIGTDRVPAMLTDDEEVNAPPTVKLVRKLLGMIDNGALRGETRIYNITTFDTKTLRREIRYGQLGKELRAELGAV